MRTLATLAVALAVLLGPARGECRTAAAFDLHTDWYGGVYIPVTAGGRSLNMLIDTGGTTSMLTASTVAALGLPLEPITMQRVTMYGGAELRNFVWLNTMRIGNASSPPTAFLVVPDDRLPHELAGTLAPDFLSRYDIDLDLAAARLNLLLPCPERFKGAIPITLDRSNHVIVPVRIDGKTIMAVMDTGASRTDLSLETARAVFGLGPGLHAAEGPDVEDGVYRYPFRSLAIGGITIDRPEIALVPDRISRRPLSTPRMVLGMSILRHYRLVIGYHEQLLHLEPAQ